MIFSPRYLAVDLRRHELRAVALRGRPRRPSLDGARIVALPDGVLNASLREPNVRDRKRLVEALRDLLHPLAGSAERLAVVLPETAGRLFLAEVETPFKGRTEGEQILKWQFKTSLPDDPAATVLDYQVLERLENGRVRLLVSAMSRKVLDQYEEIVAEAGFHPAAVGFHATYLHNYYRSRLDQPEECLLVAVESGMLILQYSQGQLPGYHRFRETGDELTAIYQEITRALAGVQESHPGMRRAEVLLHCDWADPTPLLELMKGIFQRDVLLLDPHVDRMTTTATALPAWRLRGLAAAIGAAEELM